VPPSLGGESLWLILKHPETGTTYLDHDGPLNGLNRNDDSFIVANLHERTDESSQWTCFYKHTQANLQIIAGFTFATDKTKCSHGSIRLQERVR
jgi:hypothetical protein